MDKNVEDHPDLSKAPLLTHLIELRRRLIFCMLFFTLVFCGAYYFVELIYGFLMQHIILLSSGLSKAWARGCIKNP